MVVMFLLEMNGISTSCGWLGGSNLSEGFLPGCPKVLVLLAMSSQT